MRCTKPRLSALLPIKLPTPTPKAEDLPASGAGMLAAAVTAAIAPANWRTLTASKSALPLATPVTVIGAPVWALLKVAARSFKVMLDDCVPPESVVCDSVTTTPWVLPRPLVRVSAALAPVLPVLVIFPLASTVAPLALRISIWPVVEPVAPSKVETPAVTVDDDTPLDTTEVLLPPRVVTLVPALVLPRLLVVTAVPVPILLVVANALAPMLLVALFRLLVLDALPMVTAPVDEPVLIVVAAFTLALMLVVPVMVLVVPAMVLLAPVIVLVDAAPPMLFALADAPVPMLVVLVLPALMLVVPVMDVAPVTVVAPVMLVTPTTVVSPLTAKVLLIVVAPSRVVAPVTPSVPLLMVVELSMVTTFVARISM